MNTTSFSVLRTTKQGLLDLWSARAIAMGLIPIPLIIGFLTILGIDYFEVKEPLLAAVINTPSEFIKGVVLALFARFLIYRETPETVATHKAAIPDITSAALIYATLSLVYAGLLVLMSQFIDPAKLQNNTFDVQSTIVSMVGTAFILWLFRYQWLPVGAAIGLNMRDFTRQLGFGFGLPFRIFLMWAIIAIVPLCAMMLTTEILHKLSGVAELKDLDGAYLWALYFVNVLVGILMVFWQFAASLCAIRFCMQNENGRP